MSEVFRVPVRTEGIKIRKAEPTGYDPRKSVVFKFNQTAYSILQLIDGQRHEFDIALAVAEGDKELAEELLPEFRSFLDQCVVDGLVVWKI